MGALEKVMVVRWEEFVQQCKTETALAVTKPVQRVHEDDIKYRVQAYHYKYNPFLGGWPG